MSFLKDDLDLLNIPMALPSPLQVEPGVRAKDARIPALAIFNRLGNLFLALSTKTDIDVASMVAVWLVDSGGRQFDPRRASLRFEVHQFFDVWGKRSRQEFDAHYRFGGHNLQLGNPWESHEFRAAETDPFAAVHHNQNSEYAALTLARVLAGEEMALRSAWIGTSHISLNLFSSLGYPSTGEMYTAFQESERFHVLGFFDFCSTRPAPKVGDLLRYLRGHDWLNFAKFYGGHAKSDYMTRLRASFDIASTVLNAKSVLSETGIL